MLRRQLKTSASRRALEAASSCDNGLMSAPTRSDAGKGRRDEVVGRLWNRFSAFSRFSASVLDLDMKRMAYGVRVSGLRSRGPFGRASHLYPRQGQITARCRPAFQP
jgi:hypothetical protein